MRVEVSGDVRDRAALRPRGADAAACPARLEGARRDFQMAVQWCLLEHAATLDRLTAVPGLSGDESRALARIGLANYFAGAVLLPYRAFLAAAEATGYDIGLLSDRFGVSIETVCHRLSTMQRPGEAGVPFFFVRVDRAGNISKRHSATDFHFSRIGGTCPLWNVYEAFSSPGPLHHPGRPDAGRAHLPLGRPHHRPAARRLRRHRRPVRRRPGLRRAPRPAPGLLARPCALATRRRRCRSAPAAASASATPAPSGPSPSSGAALHIDEDRSRSEPYPAR